MSSLSPTVELGLWVCMCVRACMRVPVSQVISDTELRTTVFLDLRLPVSPRPSDTVTLWRDGEETREGGGDKRNRWNLPALTPSPPIWLPNFPISKHQYDTLYFLNSFLFCPFPFSVSSHYLTSFILDIFKVMRLFYFPNLSFYFPSLYSCFHFLILSLFFLLFHEYFLKSIPSFPFTECFILESIVSLESVFSLGACFTTFNIKVAHKKTFYFNL